jgi:hypothetical protein
MNGIAVKIEERRIAGACCMHPGLQFYVVGSLKKNVFHPLKTKRGRRRDYFHGEIHETPLEDE